MKSRESLHYKLIMNKPRTKIQQYGNTEAQYKKLSKHHRLCTNININIIIDFDIELRIPMLRRMNKEQLWFIW